MKFYTKNPVVLMLLSLVAGMFFTVSFLETPMKFQVPGMTLPIALELGKMMFGISENIQLGLLILIVSLMIFSRRNYTITDFLVIAGIFIILLLEKFWMLPALDFRANLLSAGRSAPPSELHNYFIYAETVKAVLVALAIILQFKNKQNEYINH